jgi:TatD DNase family protein
MSRKLIDSHCHFDFEVFEGQRHQVISQLLEKDVAALIIPGVQPTQWGSLSVLINAYPKQLFGAVGLHPWWVESLNQAHSIIVEKLRSDLLLGLQHNNVIAIGECGLDGNIDCSMALQQLVFEVHLELACNESLPLIVHAHKAHNEVLWLLRKYKPSAGGVIHGFSGSYELARQYFQLGFKLGVGGTITYERARKTRSAIKSMPLDALLLETDAPDMPLSGKQGEINSPLYLPIIAQCLAELKSLPYTEVCDATYINTKMLFRL